MNSRNRPATFREQDSRNTNPQPPNPDSQFWLVPRPRIFGSEELSILAEAIAGLVANVELSIHPDLANRQSIAEWHAIDLEVNGQMHTLTPRFDDTIAPDVVSVPANSNEALGILGPTVITIPGGK